ncbi:polymerase [Nostoc sp. MBR 210]|nr:polymerase [Nostoc sp. MBR 210]
MLNNQSANRSVALAILLWLVGVGAAIVAGFLAVTSPKLLGLAIVAVGIVYYFFTKFEQAVLGLLILRSSLDVFSAQQIPAAFAIGLDALTLLYVIVSLLTGRIVRTDGFWWFFAGWVALQGLWLILLPLGGLALEPSLTSNALLVGMREWVRLFSWLMAYLLVMQLQERIPPEKMIATLFFSLVIPLTIAFIQVLIPPSLLPPFLVFDTHGQFEVGSRINGTLGHPATFASFLLLFIGLTCWQIGRTYQRLPWILLLATLAFFIVSTKALTILFMLLVFLLVLIIPKLNLLNLLTGILLFVVIISLFTSTEFGQERLNSILATPLLNPDIDISRAILLSNSDGNSFNWRIAQWTFLLQAWQNSPIFGYGLGTTPYLTVFTGYYAHNDYIRALAEGGIVGLGAFITFLGVQFVRLVQLMRSSPPKSSRRNLCLTLMAILSGLLVGMCTDNILTHTTLFFYWWLLLAVAGWNWNEQQPEEGLL